MMEDTGTYTIEKYLQGCIGLDFTDEMVQAALHGQAWSRGLLLTK